MITELIDSSQVFLKDGEEGADETQTASLNATFADADKIIEEIKLDNVNPPWEKPIQLAPEEANIGHANLFGEHWEKFQLTTPTDAQKEYISQIPRQIQEKLLEDPKWVELNCS